MGMSDKMRRSICGVLATCGLVVAYGNMEEEKSVSMMEKKYKIDACLVDGKKRYISVRYTGGNWEEISFENVKSDYATRVGLDCSKLRLVSVNGVPVSESTPLKSYYDTETLQVVFELMGGGSSRGRFCICF